MQFITAKRGQVHISYVVVAWETGFAVALNIVYRSTMRALNSSFRKGFTNPIADVAPNPVKNFMACLISYIIEAAGCY